MFHQQMQQMVEWFMQVQYMESIELLNSLLIIFFLSDSCQLVIEIMPKLYGVLYVDYYNHIITCSRAGQY